MMKLAETPPSEYYSYDISNLFTWIGSDDPDYVKLVIKGMNHKNEDIRTTAYLNCDEIPLKLALPFAIKGLNEKDYFIRKICAEMFAKNLGTKKELPLLQECLKKEKKKKILEQLKKAINRLEG